MGQRKKSDFFGGSQLIGAHGQSLKVASCNGEDLAFCKVDFNLQAKSRLEISYSLFTG